MIIEAIYWLSEWHQTHAHTHMHNTADKTNTHTNMEKHKQEEKMRYQTAVKQQVTDGKNMQRITTLYIKTYCLYLHTTHILYGHHGKSRE